MHAEAPRFAIVRVELFERATPLRLPFRFGATTVTQAPQAFARVELAFADGRRAAGATAELMVPKWFDKRPALDKDASIEQLRRSLALAADAYLADAAPRSAFAHAAVRLPAIVAEGARHDLPPLAALFGAAELDKAIVDALCNHLGLSFFDAVRRNAVGFEAAALASLAPDLVDADLDAALAACAPARTLECRHTVGMADAIASAEASVDDGLPASLEDAIATYGLSWFKLKLGGDVDADVARLAHIAQVLDRLPAYRVTLDGNEQYAPDALAAFVERLRHEPALSRLARGVAWIEQPIARAATFSTDLSAIAKRIPLMIDEADDRYAAFADARALGYTGVSSKSCKGLYKSLANAVRVARANAGGARLFVAAEDLTAQAGLAVQQDSALASLIGCRHAERNGHHYGFGMAAAPRDESTRFLAAHADLYREIAGVACLDVRQGRISLDSLFAPGFAHRADPDFSSMAPLCVAQPA
jgi:Enolase C-terminal domain-like